MQPATSILCTLQERIRILENEAREGRLLVAALILKAGGHVELNKTDILHLDGSLVIEHSYRAESDCLLYTVTAPMTEADEK